LANYGAAKPDKRATAAVDRFCGAAQEAKILSVKDIPRASASVIVKYSIELQPSDWFKPLQYAWFG
jgi:hypothetical protein